MIESYILNELDELGEVPLVLVIPKYLEIEKKINIHIPITDHIDNYNIVDEDFHDLSQRVLNLLVNKKLSLYEYKKGIKDSKIWEDSFDVVNDHEAKEVLKQKDKWVGNQKGAHYFLADPSQ
ncbi:MAG: hypothetical protein JXR03_20805 [Cyclobacteriaceae bacterium]